MKFITAFLLVFVLIFSCETPKPSIPDDPDIALPDPDSPDKDKEPIDTNDIVPWGSTTITEIDDGALGSFCGFSHIVDPQRLLEFEVELEEYLVMPRVNEETNITIPVAFHILHTGQHKGVTANIPDEQVHSAIDNLNKVFAGEGKYKTPGSNIRFTVAQDDSGNKGILRVNASNTADYGLNGMTFSNERTVKALSVWNHKKFLNVWVVTEINNNGGGLGIQGYAYFPGASATVDGIVILYNAIGTQGNLKHYTDLNSIFTHELGHSLGLYHSFEGDDGNRDGRPDRCPSENGCGTWNGDCVDDTPPHQRTMYNCPTKETNVCAPVNGQPGKAAAYIHNLMNYSSSECMNELTAGQIDRTLAILNTSRSGWRADYEDEEEPPNGEDPPEEEEPPTEDEDTPPAASCAPQTKDLNNRYNLGIKRVHIANMTHYSGTAVEDGGYRDFTDKKIRVEAGEQVEVSITTGPWNVEDVKVYISEKEYFSSERKRDLHKGTITVPEESGTYRLRVISDFAYFDINSFCFTPRWGQIEDYTLIVEEDDEPAPDPPEDEEEEEEEDDVLAGLNLTTTDYGRFYLFTWRGIDDVAFYRPQYKHPGADWRKSARYTGGRTVYRVVRSKRYNEEMRLEVVFEDGTTKYTTPVALN